MNTEFEVKFRAIDRSKLIAKLQELGAVQTKPDTLMRRCIFENARDPKNAYLRVRDEGGTITCTYKCVASGDLSISSVKELECKVSDFDTMVAIIREMGTRQKSYQETRREVWEIGGEVEFMIDEWPGLQPIVEIEAGSEEIVRKYCDILGFDYSQALFGTIDQVYLQELRIEPEAINTMNEITFENPPKAQ